MVNNVREDRNKIAAINFQMSDSVITCHNKKHRENYNQIQPLRNEKIRNTILSYLIG